MTKFHYADFPVISTEKFRGSRQVASDAATLRRCTCGQPLLQQRCGCCYTAAAATAALLLLLQLTVLL